MRRGFLNMYPENMTQKGFAPLIIVAVVAIVLLIGVGSVFYIKTNSLEKKTTSSQPNTTPKSFGSLLGQPTAKQAETSVANSRLGLIKLPKVHDPQVGEVGSWGNLPQELSFFKEIGYGQRGNFTFVPTTSTLLTRITSDDKKILGRNNIPYAMLPNTEKDVADFLDLFSIASKIAFFLGEYPERPENYIPLRNQGHYPFPKRIVYSADYDPTAEANLILQQANLNLTPEQLSKIKDKIYYKTDGAATNVYFAFKMPLDINRNGQKDDYLVWEAQCGFSSGMGHYMNTLPKELKRLEPGYPVHEPNFNEEKFKRWSLEYCPMNFPL